MGTKSKQNGSSPPNATPKELWRDRAILVVRGYSDSTLRIRRRGVATLLELGVFPDHLVRFALLDMRHPRGSALALARVLADAEESRHARCVEEILKFVEYQRRIAAAVLVDPALTYEEACSGEFPEDDIAMVADIILRLRDTDALEDPVDPVFAPELPEALTVEDEEAAELLRRHAELSRLRDSSPSARAVA